MPVDRHFFLMIFAASLVIGGILVAKPQAAEASIPPYLWLLGLMLLFETAAFLKNRGKPGTMIGMSTRVIGFAIGMAIILGIVFFSGSPARLF